MSDTENDDTDLADDHPDAPEWAIGILEQQRELIDATRDLVDAVEEAGEA